MSDFTKKVVDGIGSLMERVVAGDAPLSQVSEGELAIELELRKAARDQALGPRDNPAARWAGAGATAEKKRATAASAREKRVHGERAARQERERASHEKAFRQAKAQAEQAKQADFENWKRNSNKGRAEKRPRSGFGSRKDGELAKHYKTLNLDYGAEFAEVKKAYRKLMRKYHPDLHRDSPKKQKAATELSVQVTRAYNELEKHLKGK